MRALLIWFGQRHTPAIRQTGAEAATAVRAGHKAHAILIGHLPPYDAGRQGDPKHWRPMSPRASLAQWQTAIGRDDVVLFCGYQHYPVDLARHCSRVGARLTCVCLGQHEYEADRSKGVRFIDAGWPLGDALVTLPGYDVAAFAPSGIIETAAYWMVVVETAAQLR